MKKKKRGNNLRERSDGQESKQDADSISLAEAAIHALEGFKKRRREKRSYGSALLSLSTEINELRERNLSTAYSVDDKFVKDREKGISSGRKRSRSKSETTRATRVIDLERPLQTSDVPETLSEFNHVRISANR